MTTLILSVGRDQLLMKIRTMVLQRAGYQVEEAYSSSDAARLLASTRFNLVLICHTVPASEHSELAAHVRLLKPPIPIVCISRNGFHSDQPDCEVVNNFAPMFISDLRRIVGQLRRSAA